MKKLRNTWNHHIPPTDKSFTVEAKGKQTKTWKHAVDSCDLENDLGLSQNQTSSLIDRGYSSQIWLKGSTLLRVEAQAFGWDQALLPPRGVSWERPKDQWIWWDIWRYSVADDVLATCQL